MPATTGGRPTSRTTRSGYRRARPKPRPAPAPKPDITLRGDTADKSRTGHTRARTVTPQRQGHPSQGAPTVGGGTKKHPKTGVYVRGKKKVHVVPLRKYRRTQRKALRRLIERKVHERQRGGFQKAGGKIDTDTKILGINVEAELEGRGVLPKIGKKVGKALSSDKFRTTHQVAGTPIDKVAQNAGKDVADLAANLPSGLYITGASLKEAAGGDTKRLKKLAKDYGETSALVAAAKGDFGEAAKRGIERPVSTALEVSGAKAVVGRNAGRIMRSGALGPRAKRAAATERADLKLYPEGLGTKGPTEKRAYSKDVITKGVQVLGERRKRKRGQDPDLDDGNISLAGVSATRPQPRPPGTARRTGTRSRLMRRVDTRQFAAERVRKARVRKAALDTSRLAPHPSKTRYPMANRRGVVDRSESPLVHLMAEKTVTSVATARAELKARLRLLDRNYKSAARRHPAIARGNRAEAGQIRALLELDDAALNRVYLASREFAAQEGSRQARLRAAGQYSLEEQAARWFPYLQSHHRLEGAALREAAIKLEQGADRLKVGNKIIRRPKEEPAFITQRPVKLSAKGKAPEGYQPAMQGAGASAPPGGKRRGTAYELGGREVGAEALTRQAMTSEGRATAAENFQLLAQEFGIPAGEGGRLYARTYNKAFEHGKRLVEDDITGQLKPGHKALVPVNIDGLRAYGEKLQQIQENASPTTFGSHLLDRAEGDALAEAMTKALTAEHGDGRWVLMPEDVVQRLREHADVRTHDLSGMTNIFKDVVLTTSSPTTWLTGNISDLSFRSIMEGIRPADVIRGRMIVRQAETKGLQGEQAAAAVSGGGFFHASSASERFRPSAMNETAARTIGAAPWRAWKGGVYALEHFIEELPQYGRVGKAARQGDLGGKVARRAIEDRTMKQSLQKLINAQDHQVDYWATRLSSDRALEARIQQLTEDVIGRWGKVSPRLRKHLATAPFVQWLGASLRYVLVTLPVRHPVKTAIFAAIMEMTEEERARFGLSYLIPQDQRVPDYQMGTLPQKVKMGPFGLDVAGTATSNLTSFGTVGQFPHNIPGFLLPQLRGSFGALAGQAFTGEDMVYPEWWPDKSLRGLPLSAEDRRKVALGALLEVGIPFASAFRRVVLEKGQSSAPYSTILTPDVRRKWDKEHKEWRADEGSVWGGLSEWIDPFRDNKLLTHGDVRDIKQGQEAGRVFGRLRDKTDAEIRKLGGPKAVRVNERMRKIRKAMDELPQDSPKRYRLYLENRRLNQRLADLTGGKKGHDYKSGPKSREEYGSFGTPSGGHENGNPFGDAQQGGVPDDDNPFGDAGAGPSSGGEENPF